MGRQDWGKLHGEMECVLHPGLWSVELAEKDLPRLLVCSLISL